MKSIEEIYLSLLRYNEYQLKVFLLSEDNYEKQMKILNKSIHFNKVIYNYILSLSE